eukprot:UN23536
MKKLNVTVSDNGCTDEKIVEIIQKVLDNSIFSSSPGFLFKLYGGSEYITQVSELVATIINANAYTFSAAPAFTVIEEKMIEIMGRFIYPDPTIKLHGVFSPGGSYSNMLSLLIA